MSKADEKPHTDEPSVSALTAAAAWNAEKGLEILRWEKHEKNNERATGMLRDAGRFLHNHDCICRKIWLIEHTKKRRKS